MHHKSKLDSDKKAYLQIDFAFAVLIFTFFAVTTYSYYKDYDSAQSEVLIINEFEANARDLCYLFINTPGSPINWESNFNQTNSFGFKDLNSKNLSNSKFTILNQELYFDMIKKMDLNSTFVWVKIIGLETDTDYLTLGDRGLYDSINANYQCYSKYNSEIVKVFVEVWK